MTDRGQSDARSHVGAFWDERYAGDDYRYGKQPNAFLTEVVDRIPAAGRVLCVGDGEGRNGVWLAQQGFDVTAVEPSAVGAQKIRRLAAERGVEIDVIEDALPDHELPERSFDAVVLIFVHMPPAMRVAVHSQVTGLLRPGGVVLLEAYTPKQLAAPGVGGPQAEQMLFTSEILDSDFATLQIEWLVETMCVLDEGPGHQGESAVIRLVACNAE